MPTPLRLWPKALLAAGFYLWGAAAAHAQFTTEGSREAAYGAPLAVQHNPTGFGDNTLGSQSLANGSELDAVYARVVGSTLHVFLAGNLESNGNKLDVFFDTKLGGQNALLGTNPDVDNNGLNAMAGLTFDSGFSADYYMSAGVSPGTTTAVVDAFYATLNDPTNTGGSLASGPSSNQTLIFPGIATHGEIGIDNSNILGVTGADLGDPRAVATGIELQIPLAAIGTPTADFRICVFINGGQHNFLSNQMLGTLPANAGNLGSPANVRLNQLSGGQSVLIPMAASPAARALMQLSAGALDFGSVPTGTTATRTIDVSNVGTAALTVSQISASNARFAASVAPTTIAANATGTLTVTFSPNAAGAQVGTLSFSSNDPNQPAIEIGLSGSGAGTGTPVIDGTRDAAYGSFVALQTTGTGFGDNSSELDGAYVRTDADNLYILLTGNLEANGNPLELFFDSKSGGQNILAGTNPDVDNNALGALAGLHFDTSFSPDYYLTVRGNGAGAAYTITAGFTPLTGAAGTGTALAGGAAGASAVLQFSATQLGQVAVNNSNTGGVTDAAVGSPDVVTTGIELQIPLSVLGSPTSTFQMAAMINGGGHNFLSNQVLGGLPLGTANLGSPTAVNFSTLAGNQFFPVDIAVPTSANISVTPDPLAVGSVTVGSTGTGTLTVTNSGTAALNITGITSSNGLFTVSPTTATVAAGGSTTLTVTFAPTAVGAQTGTLTINSNAAGAPTTTVAVSGTGTAVPVAVLSTSVTTLSVGSVVIGSTGTGTLYVRNTGTAALNLTGITSTNTVFSAAPTTGTVAPGDSLLVTVTFTPTAAGAQTANLAFASNGGSATVAVSGTGTAAAAITVDGTLDTNYGAALALQTTPTGFGDNQSELDGAYAHIANGMLYVLLTGNLEANGNRLNLFFDTNSGTGQRTLAANNADVDNNGLNRHAGLSFDNGFTADYFLTTNLTNPAGGLTGTASFAPVNGGGGTGTLLTSGAAGLTQSLAFSASLTGSLAIDNSNVGGVTDAAVGTPGAVTTGIEYAIPLASLGNPTGPIRISAFVTNNDHSFMSNQVLAGLPLGTGNLGNPSNVNFSSFAGNQFFSVANGAPEPLITASASTLAFGNTTVSAPTTRTLVLHNIGTAALNITGITSDNTVFTAAPTTGTVAVGDSLVVTVTFDPTAAGTQSGTLTVTSNDPGQPTLTVGLTGTGVAAPTAVIGVSATTLALGAVTVGSTGTATFRVRNTGNAALNLTGIVSSDPQFTAAPTTGTIAIGDSLLVTVTFAPTTAGAATGTLTLSSDGGTATVALTGTGIAPALITVDGTRDTSYPAPLAVQTTPTGFGNSTSGTQDVALGGSELDAAYGVVDNGMLYLLLTGNLESNGNKLEIFLDTQTGGQNVLLNTNPDVDGNGLNRQAGLTFDAGFAPEYYFTMNNTNTAAFGISASFAPVNGAGGVGTLLGAGANRTQALTFGAGLMGMLSLDNSNIGGVDGSTVGTPETVTTGVELAIPLAALGNPTGPIRISAFINGAQHDFVSNQVLAGLPNGTGNLGNPANVNFGTPAGNQFFAVPNGTLVVAPAIELSTTSLTFGDVPINTSGVHTGYVRNIGTDTLNVASLVSSSPLFTVFPANATIAPGDSILVMVTFSPTVPGVFTSVLTITSDDPNQPTVTVQLSGTGAIGILSVSRNPIVFPATPVGSTSTETFYVRNSGNAPFTFTAFTQGNLINFSTDPLNLDILDPGDSTMFTVTFTPTTAGAVSGSLTISTTLNLGQPTAVVNFSGSGVVGLAEDLAAAHLHLYPNPATAAHGLTVEWTGATALQPTAVLLDGLGRTVQRATLGAQGGTFPLTGLAPGIYTLRLTSSAGPINRRVVVE